MLTDEKKQVIEAQAIATVRADWGRTDTRLLGDVIADLAARIEAGTLGQSSFAEQIVEAARAAHAETIAARDDVAVDGPEFDR